METDRRQPEAPEQPLPPPPLSEPTGTGERLGPLPWSTPLLMAMACGVSGVVWKYWYAGPDWQTAAVRCFIVAGALMGLGACAMDRAAGSWPRAVRWAIGMSGGTAAFAVAAREYLWHVQPYLHPTFQNAPAYALHWLLSVTALCPALGLLLGLLAHNPRTRHFMPLAAMGWLAFAAAAIHLGLMQSPHTAMGRIAWLRILRGFGHFIGGITGRAPSSGGLFRYVVSDAVLGLLIGLAMAVAASRAGKRF